MLLWDHLTSSRFSTGGEQHHEWPQNWLVVKQWLFALSQKHLIHPQLLQLHVLSELPPQTPQEQPLQNPLQNHKLQDWPHGST